MSVTDDELRQLHANPSFPRSNGYDGAWVAPLLMGPNALWLTEWLCEVVSLGPGMRVLDLGCGKALSSIFLAREFGVHVCAADLWIKPTENAVRIEEAGLADRVFPIHAEAHRLPFADDYFDAILALDSYAYFGTDDLYLRALTRFLKPGGTVGIVVPGLVRDFDDGVPPDHLTRPQENGAVFWADDCWSFHTADWWRRHWAHHSQVEVLVSEAMPDAWRHWIRSDEAWLASGTCPFPSDREALEADGGRYLTLVRVVARRPKPLLTRSLDPRVPYGRHCSGSPWRRVEDHRRAHPDRYELRCDPLRDVVRRAEPRVTTSCASREDRGGDQDVAVGRAPP